MNSVILSLAVIATAVTSSQGITYPKVSRDEKTVDDYFGKKVPDPYRWMENPDSPATKKFVQEENQLTKSFLDKDPLTRQKINATFSQIYSYPLTGFPRVRGNSFYIQKIGATQSQFALYKSSTLEGLLDPKKCKTVIDPNPLSKDGTVAYGLLVFSKNGEMVAYTLSESGSDWSTTRIINTTTFVDFPEVLKNTNDDSTIAWTHDNLGFLYSGYLSPTSKNMKLYYHRVGQTQEQDNLVLEYPEQPDTVISIKVSDDGDYAVVSISPVIGVQQILVGRIPKTWDSVQFKKSLIPLTPDALFTFEYLGNDGPKFYFRTNNGAPNFRVVGIQVTNPAKKNWLTLVPQNPKAVLNLAQIVAHDKLLISYIKDVKGTLELRDLKDGKLLTQVNVPDGSISFGKNRREDTKAFFDISNFADPGAVYYLDLANSTSQSVPKLFSTTEISGVDTKNFIVKQVFYKSKDGKTKVPMFIMHKKGYTPKKGKPVPTLLHGYGGFQVSMEPAFYPEFLAFVEIFDGVFAQPNIRGGGEYGTSWWEQGHGLNKQNSFDDFIAAAEYLVKEGYTVPSKLSVYGSSNGGLLVAACVNQRPELFGAANPDVGVLDMLRFQKFGDGGQWCAEYGCSDRNRTEFDNLLKYSPLHNVKANTVYPAVLVTTADHDDRVGPMGSYKYTAQLQNVAGKNPKQKQPLLLQVDTDAGHGDGKPQYKVIAEYVDRFSFFQQTLKYKVVTK